MSNHTPPRYWNSRPQARKWLVELLSDTEDFGSWTIDDTENLCDEIFDAIRRGWRMMIVLRRPFRRNPEALLAFAKEFLAREKKKKE